MRNYKCNYIIHEANDRNTIRRVFLHSFERARMQGANASQLDVHCVQTIAAVMIHT